MENIRALGRTPAHQFFLQNAPSAGGRPPNKSPDAVFSVRQRE